MAEAAGEEHFFPFGLTAEQVAGSRGWYSPQWHYDNEPETRAALDLIFTNHFSRNEPGVFEPLREMLLTRGTTSCTWRTSRLSGSGPPAAGPLRTPRRVDAQGHPQRGQLRPLVERSHDRGVRGRDLERQAVPGAMTDDAP
jgi:hypothetical protein